MTPTSHVHPAIRRYMRRLEAELSILGSAERDEILNEVRDHLRLSLVRDSDAPPTDAEIASALAKLGQPTDIAAAARERFGVPPARAGAIDVTTVLLVAVGNLLAPLIAGLVGILLISRSPAWVPAIRRRATILILASFAGYPLVVLGVAATQAVAGFASALVVVALVLTFGAPLAAAATLVTHRSASPSLRATAVTLAATVLVGIPAIGVYAPPTMSGSSTDSVTAPATATPTSASAGPTSSGFTPTSELCHASRVTEGLGLNQFAITYRYCATASTVTHYSQPECTATVTAARARPLLCVSYPSGDNGSFAVRAEFAVAPWTFPVERTVTIQVRQEPGSVSTGP